MQSIFTESGYNEIISRFNSISENTKPLWGKMNASQMLWHCQGPLNIILQKKDYKLKPNFIIKLFFKKTLYNDKPWTKNLPTTSHFKTLEVKDFTTELNELKSLINELYERRSQKEWQPHPVFGKFTNEQWGKLQYKHLDHHLKQFGV